MRVSAKAEYACLAMLALARHGPDTPPVRIREISESHGIPERYLVQILLQLKSAGLVTSTRGASGGYHLARPASAISIGQILAAVEGPDLAARIEPASRCPDSAVLDPVWESARAAQRAVLDSTTLDQLARQAAPIDWTI